MPERTGSLLTEAHPRDLPPGPTAVRARHAATAAGVGVPVLAGLAHGWLAPRGPLHAGEAVGWIVVLLVVGVVAGERSRTRWAVLGVPLVFLAAVEAARVGAVGATVDAIDLGSAYGVMALVVGRVAHGLLVLPALVLGVIGGVAAARRIDGTPGRGHVLGRAGTGLLALAVVASVVAISRPASTAPIVGPDGEPVAGSIAELVTVRIGGRDQSILLRGRSATAPVLLHLAGGPGGTDVGAMRDDVGLEEHVVVATWDQRGTGRSYAAIDPVGEMTLDRMVSDTIAVAAYLTERFDQDRILVSGNSWGTILGTLAVERRPDLFRAYIGTGQMVDVRATDVMFYEDTLAWAIDRGEDELARTLQRQGPPPYVDPTWYGPAVSLEHRWNAYPGVDDLNEMPFNTFVPENTLLDRLNAARGLLDTFVLLYPQLQELDLRTAVPRLEVPVYVVTGRYEARGRRVLADEWFASLDAPAKEQVVFERSGHRPSFEEPDVFAALVARVLAETDGS